MVGSAEQSGGGVWARQGENLLECTAQAYLQGCEYRWIVVDNKYCSVFHLFVFCYIFCLQKYTFFLK